MIVKDWKKIIKKAISIWLLVFALFCYAGTQIMFKFFDRDTDPYLFFYLGLFSIIGAIAGRLLEQDRPPLIEALRVVSIIIAVIIISLLAAFVTNSSAYAVQPSSLTNSQYKEKLTLDIAVPLIARWEGLRLSAYEDIVGVVTICYGSTRGIKMGMTKTRAECEALLRSEAKEYFHGWLEYVEPYTYDNHVPPHRGAVYTSFAINVGIHGAGKSTSTRRLNKGNIRGACIALSWWNKAGGRVIMGLVNRRKDEVIKCINA